jgi:hypothetical protein
VARCGETEAYALHAGRTEWATIQGWYVWATIPTDFVPDDYDLPAAITQVIFVEPPVAPGASAAQLFNLDYQDDELSSGEARAFLIRSERVLEQGKPAKNSTQVQLTGAEVGDLLCVYDINDHAEGTEMPRHQFGCETIVAGDDTLVMTKDTLWSPEIALQQVGPNQLQVTVDAALSGAAADAMTLRLFPEHESGLAPLLLPRAGDVYSATITLPDSVPPLYAQVFVDESPDAPQTRREVIADRGTGGGGAYGPARFYGDVLVMSSDGNATYQNSELTELNEGESIAFQSMPGTPPLPFPLRIIGQSYRLDAYPASLVDGGTVSLRYTNEDLLAAGAAGAGDEPAIWFWDGASWSPLATSTIEPVNGADGVRVATAPSQGVGVYAVLVPADAASNRFLPIIAQ